MSQRIIRSFHGQQQRLVGPWACRCGAAVCLAGLFMSAAGAATLTVPLGMRQSIDGLGDPNNQVLSLALPAGSTVRAVGWTNAVLETGPGGTWGSHARIRLSDSAQSAPVDVLIFDGANMPSLWGPESQNPPESLGPEPGLSGPELFGHEFAIGGDGQLRIEFYESVDNNPNALDAIWVGGSLIIDYALPCPADIDGSGGVNVDDLLSVINAWGSADPQADIDDSGTVEVNDLLAVINGWGACP